MANYVTNYGLELPIFDSPVHQPTEGSVLGSSQGVTSFVRRIDVIGVARQLSLRRMLTLTDNELENLSGHCGTEVVNHTWGLVDEAQDADISKYLEDGPFRVSNYVLAAMVDVIHPLDPNLDKPAISRDQDGLVDAGMRRYRNSKESGQWLIGDLTHSQFIEGIKPDGQDGVVLCDVDVSVEITNVLRTNIYA